MSHRLRDVKEEYAFVTCQGSRLRSLYALSKELGKMDAEAFSHHVNEERNDFGQWVFDIIKDYTLARQLRRTKDQKKMRRLVKRRVLELEKSTENVANLDVLARESDKEAVKSLFEPSKPEVLEKPGVTDVSHLYHKRTSDASDLFKKAKKKRSRPRRRKASKARKKSAPTPPKRKLSLPKVSMPKLKVPRPNLSLPGHMLDKMGKSKWKYYLYDLALLSLGVGIGYLLFNLF